MLVIVKKAIRDYSTRFARVWHRVIHMGIHDMYMWRNKSWKVLNKLNKWIYLLKYLILYNMKLTSIVTCWSKQYGSNLACHSQKSTCLCRDLNPGPRPWFRMYIRSRPLGYGPLIILLPCLTQIHHPHMCMKIYNI